MVKIQTTTKSKKRYLKEWKSYINQLYTLTWVRDPKLSNEVTETINKMNELVDRVADEKFSKKKSREMM